MAFTAWLLAGDSLWCAVAIIAESNFTLHHDISMRCIFGEQHAGAVICTMVSQGEQHSCQRPF